MKKNPSNGTSSTEAVDQLLGDYFKAQLPERFPGAPRVSNTRLAQVPTVQPSDSLSASRWALAASVMLLLGACWYVSQVSTDGRVRTNNNLDGTTANLKAIKDLGSKSR